MRYCRFYCYDVTNFKSLKRSVFCWWNDISITSRLHSVSWTLWMPSHVFSCEYSGFPPFQTTSRTLCIWYSVSHHRFHPSHPAGSLFDSRRRPCPVRCTGRDTAAPSADGRWRGAGQASGARCNTGRTADTGGMSRRTCAVECAHGKPWYLRCWSHRQRIYGL